MKILYSEEYKFVYILSYKLAKIKILIFKKNLMYVKLDIKEHIKEYNYIQTL